jgi:hypothetical protein
MMAAIVAAIANYVVQKEDTMPSEALNGVGKTVINSYNFLNKLNEKYSVTNKVTDYIDNSVSEFEIVAKGKEAYSSATTKLSELDGENSYILLPLSPLFGAFAMRSLYVRHAIALRPLSVRYAFAISSLCVRCQFAMRSLPVRC